ncbi:FtsQ-type POTRA domain-containing protein, partial [bacterium]|nr:FtsQ-type POTRA domain-containing protein [bacterium]
MRNKFKRRHQIKRKKPLFKNRFFLSLILAFFLILALSYFLFFSQAFQVKEIKINGIEKLSEKEILALIQKTLKRKILFFTTKNIFLAPLSEIKKEIFQNFPIVNSVEINKKLPQTLVFKISERKPIAIFCQAEKCFSIDKEGVVFEENFSKDFVEIENKKDISPVKIGEKVIAEEELSKILEIQENLEKDLEISVQKFIILPDRLTVEFKEGWRIFLDLKANINWQLLKLKVVLEEKIPPEKREKLDYIELRFENLAPYKYK